MPAEFGARGPKNNRVVTGQTNPIKTPIII